MVTDFTKPVDSQYGHGAPRVRSSDCFTRLRVMATSPKSLNCSTFDGARSCAQRFFQRLHDFLPVPALIHVDEVDDDDAAQVAQPNLPHDLLDRIDVGLDDRVFQTRRLAHVLAGVDVDRYQRFGLVDDDVAAALQPDFRLERLVDLVLDAELLEQRRFFGVELDPLDQRRLEAVGEAQDALVLLSVSTQMCEKSAVTWSRSTRSTTLDRDRSAPATCSCRRGS